jgi:regulatory protein
MARTGRGWDAKPPAPKRQQSLPWSNQDTPAGPEPEADLAPRQGRSLPWSNRDVPAEPESSPRRGGRSLPWSNAEPADSSVPQTDGHRAGPSYDLSSGDDFAGAEPPDEENQGAARRGAGGKKGGGWRSGESRGAGGSAGSGRGGFGGGGFGSSGSGSSGFGIGGRGRGGRRGDDRGASRGGAEQSGGQEDAAGQESGAGEGRRREPPARDPYEVAREICLRQLAVRPRTRAELASALKKKEVDPEVAAAVLDRYDEVGMIDDAAFAKAWVTSRHHSKGLASRALAQELRRKGVDQEVAAGALSELDDETEAQTALELALRKLKTTRGEPDQVFRRLVGMLARKGYPGGVAVRAVKEALATKDAELADLIDPDAYDEV